MIELNGKVIPQCNFPDGTLLMKCLTPSHTSKIIHWHYENDAELFSLICIVKKIREEDKDAYIKLFMPYLPHARQDRVKEYNDVFTLKYFCEVINSLNINEVCIKDVHSNVGIALLDRAKNTMPWPEIEQAIKYIPVERELVAFYPDEGAMKRYSGGICLPFAFGIKRRDWETGKIEGLDLSGNVGAINGADVLIIDDICSRGGTFYHSALRLKEAGAANIYLYVTHCENTIHEGELLKDNGLIERVYTTKSILTKYHDKITLV